jgi:hypothetical protein
MSEFPVDVVKLIQQGADPGATAGSGEFYTKSASGTTHAFYQDSAGTVHQLTPAVPESGAVGYSKLQNITVIGPATVVNNSTALQPVFAAANDTVTLAASTKYLLRARYHFSAVDGTGRGINIDFHGGTVTYPLFTWGSILTVAHSFTANGPNSPYFTNIFALTASAPPWLVTASSSPTHRIITIHGVLTTSASGTFIPRFSWTVAGSGAVTCTLVGDSYLELIPLGTSSFLSKGWA